MKEEFILLDFYGYKCRNIYLSGEIVRGRLDCEGLFMEIKGWWVGESGIFDNDFYILFLFSLAAVYII